MTINQAVSTAKHAKQAKAAGVKRIATTSRWMNRVHHLPFTLFTLHVSAFSHSSYKDAPRQCLAAFDELRQTGIEAFTQKQDPYWDIPLGENLPQPVIELPGLQNGERSTANSGDGRTPGEAHQAELFDIQTNPAPVGSGNLFVEQPVSRTKKTRKKN